MLAPFLLREVHPALEPYPAILLPTGRAMLHGEGGRFVFSRSELRVVLRNGEDVRVDVAEFLDPIPRTYWRGMAPRGYGLPDSAPWVKQRLSAIGYPNAAALRTQVETVQLDPASRTVTVLSTTSHDVPIP